MNIREYKENLENLCFKYQFMCTYQFWKYVCYQIRGIWLCTCDWNEKEPWNCFTLKILKLFTAEILCYVHFEFNTKDIKLTLCP